MPPIFSIVDGTPAIPPPARRPRRKRPAYQALIRMSDRRLADRELVRVVLAGVLLVAPDGVVHRAPPNLRQPCNGNRPVQLC